MHLNWDCKSLQRAHVKSFLHKIVYCLLYTSDAADDLLCVDLGGRRIIKKKTTIQYHNTIQQQKHNSNNRLTTIHAHNMLNVIVMYANMH